MGLTHIYARAVRKMKAFENNFALLKISCKSISFYFLMRYNIPVFMRRDFTMELL